MFRYAVSGIELCSDLPLPSLRPAWGGERTVGASSLGGRDPAAEGLLRLSFVRSEEPLGEPARWLYTETLGTTTQPWRAVGVSPRGFFVRLFGAVDFLLERDAPSARYALFPSAPLGVVEPLFLEQALPLWLSLLGRPSLHASAVAWGEGEHACAIAFAGRSGSGKSTLATRLASSARGSEGGLIADDCLSVELAGDRLLAHPGHRAVRLLEDSAHALFADPEVGDLSLDGNKRRVEVPAAERPLPLVRFYVLEPTLARPRTTHLRRRDAVGRLATHLFRIDPEDYGRLPAELDLLDRLAARVRVVRLEVPRRYDALDDVRAAIAADLASG